MTHTPPSSSGSSGKEETQHAAAVPTDRGRRLLAAELFAVFGAGAVSLPPQSAVFPPCHWGADRPCHGGAAAAGRVGGLLAQRQGRPHQRRQHRAVRTVLLSGGEKAFRQDAVYPADDLQHRQLCRDLRQMSGGPAVSPAGTAKLPVVVFPDAAVDGGAALHPPGLVYEAALHPCGGKGAVWSRVAVSVADPRHLLRHVVLCLLRQQLLLQP